MKQTLIVLLGVLISTATSGQEAASSPPVVFDSHAGVAGPHILVGSAFGGDSVRTFADLYMGEVAGLVLVDADSDDVGPKAMQEEQHRREVVVISHLRDCRNAIAEHKPLPPLHPGQPQTCAQQFFRGYRKLSGPRN